MSLAAISDILARLIAAVDAATPMQGTAPRYQNLPLRVGDSGPPVQQLHEDLASCGFKVWDPDRPDPDAGQDYTESTQRAVRMFQIYARMQNAALLGANEADLQAVPNPARYPGPVTGEFDEATAASLDQWVNHPGGPLLCPVRVTSYGEAPGSVVLHNLWGAYDDASLGPANEAGYRRGHQVEVVDVSGHWQPTPYRGPLGSFVGTPHGDGPVRYACGRTHPADFKHPDPIAPPVTPRLLIGRAADELTPAERSTYNVIASVARVECGACLDGLTGYDHGVVSFGICHWTLALGVYPPMQAGEQHPKYTAPTKGAVAAAEGPPLLSYFADRAWESYLKHFGRLGIAPEAPLLVPGWQRYQATDQRKYEAIARHSRGGDPAAVYRQIDAASLRNWHTMYWLLRAVNDPELARLMFTWTLRRLHDVLNTAVPGITRSGAPAKLRDLATTEATVWLLLRVHVNRPKLIVSQRPKDNLVCRAVGDAKLGTELTQWSDGPGGDREAFQKALLAAADHDAPGLRLGKEIAEPAPGTGQTLSTAANSFSLMPLQL
jgi:hypothetical protein